VGYSDMKSELEIIRMMQEEEHKIKVYKNKIPQAMIFAARDEISQIVLSDEIGEYIVLLVFATRYPLRHSKQLSIMIETGVSPRASLALSQCARVRAWLQKRTEVNVEDVQSVIHDVFRHRLIKSDHTNINNIQNDEIIDILLAQVLAPKASKK